MKIKIHLLLMLFLLIIQIVFLSASKSLNNYFIFLLASSSVYLISILLLRYTEFQRKYIILIAISFFIIKTFFIDVSPIGSDDYYRYIWDGKINSNGINPFLYEPNSAKLASYHSDLLPDKVSYPHIKTIYFPVSQWIFTLAYQISGENAIGLKLIYLLFEFITLLALCKLLKHFNLDRKYLLIYATLPLITFQFFIDAHIDIVGTALMISSIAFYFYNRKYLSYILLGLSISVKPTGFLLLPFYFQNEVIIKEKLKSIIIPLVIFLITFLPYFLSATPIDTLINYSINWTFNGMIYNVLSLFVKNTSIIRLLSGLLFIVVFGWIYSTKKDILIKIYLSLFLMMLFSPVVHPWYLIWFAVLLPMTRSYSGIYFVTAICTTFLTVVTFQITGVWRESPIILLIEYLPLTVIFLYEIIKQKVFAGYN